MRNFHLDDDDVAQLASTKSLCNAFKRLDRQLFLTYREGINKMTERHRVLALFFS